MRTGTSDRLRPKTQRLCAVQGVAVGWHVASLALDAPGGCRRGQRRLKNGGYPEFARTLGLDPRSWAPVVFHVVILSPSGVE